MARFLVKSPNPSDRLAVINSLAEVRTMHAKGVDSLARVPETKYGGMKAEAERLNIHQDYLRKCRTFAAEYDLRRLDGLCAACEAGGYPIGWSRIILLLIVPKTDRDKMLKGAIKGHWTREQMVGEIRRRYGRKAKKGAGRPTKLADDGSPGTSYEKVLRLCSQFESFMEAMRRQGPDERMPLDHLPPSTRACMVRAEETMTALHLAVAKKVTRIVRDDG
jgi:hypothetical protein